MHHTPISIYKPDMLQLNGCCNFGIIALDEKSMLQKQNIGNYFYLSVVVIVEIIQ